MSLVDGKFCFFFIFANLWNLAVLTVPCRLTKCHEKSEFLTQERKNAINMGGKNPQKQRIRGIRARRKRYTQEMVFSWSGNEADNAIDCFYKGSMNHR